ncbi:MAG: hypothetical protein AAGE43_14630 [Pseudomonadota bacterium]
MIGRQLLTMLLAMLAASAMADVEQERLGRLEGLQPTIDYESLLHDLDLANCPEVAGATVLGTELWARARTRAQGGEADDRPLYWARLAAQQRLSQCDAAALVAFERASRGFGRNVAVDPGVHRVFISGFDPFHLDSNLAQSNPSGLAALLLDGTTVETRAGPARIETVVVPVRFRDFDEGLIEREFEPLLRVARHQLLVTVSMGRDAFDLERFPGRRRSSAVTDNLNVLTGANLENPLVPALKGEALAGPEFVEFSLPAQAMAATSGPYAVRDNRQVRTLEGGARQVSRLEDLAGETAVAGSGGGYLSNEISYRSVRLNSELARELGREPLPLGHLHTPRIAGFDREAELAIVAQIRDLLVAGLEAVLADQLERDPAAD